jgi:hypothetical protein
MTDFLCQNIPHNIIGECFLLPTTFELLLPVLDGLFLDVDVLKWAWCYLLNHRVLYNLARTEVIGLITVGHIY